MAWRNGVAVSAAEYLKEVHCLASLLPDGSHILNDCHDRYHFAVALGAMLVRGKINLLPSNRTSETIRKLLQFAPDAVCLTDQPDCTIELPQLPYPDAAVFAAAPALAHFAVPEIGDARLVAHVFTSGSTGAPVAHRKTWAALVQNVQMEAAQLGLVQGRSYSIVGTVPAQHMYGFESTVLIALVNGLAIASGHSFYPADIALCLEQVPAPRVLVTTPVHLRLLLASGLALPAIELLVSATAPLAPQLAIEAERVFNAPLMEIYGSTETGQIATRRPAQSPEWTLFPNLEMQRQGECMWISGGHVETPMPMQDVIEPTTAGRFLLHGRLTDLINIAGKRSSLAYLNHHLNSIAGVEDGVFYMPAERACGEVTRLTAFVVAPALDVADIMVALRQKIDTAFLPRPLHKVACLPRNSTGKITQQALAALAASHAVVQPGTELSGHS